MLITELTNTALRIAYQSHLGQTDRGGVPYIHHPVHVAEQMDTEARTVEALLHDVIEDAGVTPEELLREGIPEPMVETVVLLTRRKAEPYLDYIRRITDSGNSDAIAIKYADICHNLDASRLKDGALPKNLLERYTAAKIILEPLVEVKTVLS